MYDAVSVRSTVFTDKLPERFIVEFDDDGDWPVYVSLGNVFDLHLNRETALLLRDRLCKVCEKLEETPIPEAVA